MAGITSAQLRKVWAVARELNLNDDHLHDLVRNETGKEHISELTIAEAIRVIDLMETYKEDRCDMATKRQLWKLDQLIKELGWSEPKHLRGFLRKYAKVEHPRWLTKEQASKAIEGLKAILKNTQHQGASNG